MIKKNDDFDLTITGYTSEGSGVGKKDGIAVFVENTAKNDVIKCHIIKATAILCSKLEYQNSISNIFE